MQADVIKLWQIRSLQEFGKAGFQHIQICTSHAIGADRPRCKESMVFSTQSTHKLLAGLSQASQILVQDAENQKLSEQRFHSLYSSMTEGVALHELLLADDGTPVNYRIMDVNPAYESILGIKRDAVIGRLSHEVYGSVAYLDEFSGVAQSGKPLRFKANFEPMGKIFSISVFAPALNQFATIFQDVTELSRTEASLRESEERLRLALTAANQAWFDLDLLTGNIHVSPNYPKMIGFTVENFDSNLDNWQASVHPDDLDVLKQSFQRCLKDALALLGKTRNHPGCKRFMLAHESDKVRRLLRQS